MPSELGYFTIGVKETAPAVKFYSALFGWEIDATPMGAHVKNTKLPMGLLPGAAASIPFAYFRVEDIEAATKLVAKLGGQVRERSESPSGLIAVCADDQGTVFSIWQPAPGFG